jgi:hypothetical protein
MLHFVNNKKANRGGEGLTGFPVSVRPCVLYGIERREAVTRSPAKFKLLPISALRCANPTRAAYPTRSARNRKAFHIPH